MLPPLSVIAIHVLYDATREMLADLRSVPEIKKEIFLKKKNANSLSFKSLPKTVKKKQEHCHIA